MDIAPAREEREPEAEERTEAPRRRKRERPIHSLSDGANKRRTILFGGIIVALGFLIFLTSLLWRDAELIVHPRFENVLVQATFSAHQTPQDGALGYELLALEEVGERTVSASGAEEVEELATGTVTLYNAYSTEPQRLIKNTRLESPDGKIFRITESAVIPGATKNDAGETVPGKVSASVFADAAGDSYNIAPARFTVPGLEGTDQYEGTYAESSEAMRGGFIGTKLIVDEATLTETTGSMHAELAARLMERLGNERPAGFELYSSSARIRYESLPSVDAGENRATVREKAILEVPIFRNEDLARYIAQNTIAAYQGEPVRIDNAQDLAFSYVEPAEDTEETPGGIDFTLAGNARIVWDYDEEQLRADVAGTSKKDLTGILSQYSAIPKAETVIKPFWKRSFPDDPTRIKITEVIQAP